MSVVESAGINLSRSATIALSIAAGYAVLLIVAGFTAPVYSWTSESQSGELAQGSETLVAVNGPGIVLVLGAPLLATLLVASALRLRSRRAAVPFAWVVTGLLAVLTLLAIASIGLAILPTTVALVVACAASPQRRQPDAAADPAAHGE